MLLPCSLALDLTTDEFLVGYYLSCHYQEAQYLQNIDTILGKALARISVNSLKLTHRTKQLNPPLFCPVQFRTTVQEN